MRCPSCGNESRFMVTVEMRGVAVSVDGDIEDYEVTSTEIDEDGWARCLSCDEEGYFNE